LITKPWRRVPSGTNGGITLFGTIFSAIGGLIIGLAFLFLDKICSGLNVQLSATIIFSTICGLVGSIIDSVLGATLQTTYFDEEKKLVYCESKDAPPKAIRISGMSCLSNAQVNLLSVLITTIVGGFLFAPKLYA
jgi:uncharacterized membrane protein